MVLRTVSKALGLHLGTRNGLVAHVAAVAGATAATDLISAATLTALGTRTKFWATDIIINCATVAADTLIPVTLLAGAVPVISNVLVGGGGTTGLTTMQRLVHLKFEKPLLFDTSAGTAVRYSTGTAVGSATANITVMGFWTSNEDDAASF